FFLRLCSFGSDERLQRWQSSHPAQMNQCRQAHREKHRGRTAEDESDCHTRSLPGTADQHSHVSRRVALQGRGLEQFQQCSSRRDFGERDVSVGGGGPFGERPLPRSGQSLSYTAVAARPAFIEERFLPDYRRGLWHLLPFKALDKFGNCHTVV